MKILLYNWVQFDNKEKYGGGVSVYIKNLIEHLIKDKKNDVYFLSSGNKYNPLKSKPYVKKVKNMFGNLCKTYEVINSEIIGPLGTICWDIDKYLYCTKTTEVMVDFIKKHGPFDIIHIHNIGGFSQDFLKIKKIFPNTKFIFDLHNYNCFCMNSYLFNQAEGTICKDYKNGEHCLTCYKNIGVPQNLYHNRVKLFWKENLLSKIIYKITHNFKNSYKKNEDKFYTKTYKNRRCNAQSYVDLRKKNIEYINKYFDCILAVSEKVKQVAINYGIDEKKIKVSYIGTKFAENTKAPKKYNSNTKFKIAYLGYANVLKGFHFLLDVFSSFDNELAGNVEIMLAAKGAKQEIIQNKLSNFAKVELINGYTHDNIESILENVDLGIVPVLWDDNLPQVAIEMVSNGVPILCSDFGGASELSSSNLFKFKGGDEEDLKSKLIHLIQNPIELQKYWDGHCGLMTMEKHVEFLYSIYKNSERGL